MLVKVIGNFNRFKLNGELNVKYMKGATVMHKKLKSGTNTGNIIGYYLGNDRKTPRFKVKRKDGRVSDWNEVSCYVMYLEA